MYGCCPGAGERADRPPAAEQSAATLWLYWPDSGRKCKKLTRVIVGKMAGNGWKNGQILKEAPSI